MLQRQSKNPIQLKFIGNTRATSSCCWIKQQNKIILVEKIHACLLCSLHDSLDLAGIIFCHYFFQRETSCILLTFKVKQYKVVCMGSTWTIPINKSLFLRIIKGDETEGKHDSDFTSYATTYKKTVEEFARAMNCWIADAVLKYIKQSITNYLRNGSFDPLINLFIFNKMKSTPIKYYIVRNYY